MRIDNLEFRYSELNSKYELVEWVKFAPGMKRPVNNPNSREYCFVIAFFEKDNEGCNIRFIGDRPFHTRSNFDSVWKMLKYGQTVVDAEIELKGTF